MQEFQISKDDFATKRLITVDPISIDAGEVLLDVQQFSFTANNITYAVMGERLRYWQFFPASDDGSDKWGLIPVWGFATIIESKCQELSVGERLFGYFPPASQVKMSPSNITDLSLFDGTPHRADLPPGYNIYRRVESEPDYSADFDAERMLLYPLFITAFSLHDMLSENQWYDAEQIIIGSASSKTSIGLAYALAEDKAAPPVVGLTSDRNLGSVKKLGIYDSTATYGELTDIDATKKSVIVDMSANGEMLGRLHSHLGENMRFCSNVGLTHWDNAQAGEGYIQERSEMFFAPSQIQKRMQDWGSDGFQLKSSAFIHRTALKCREWLTLENIDGLEGLQDVYDNVCHGKVPPEKGLIITV